MQIDSNMLQADCDIRDYGKKVQQLEIGFDETNDKLVKATESLEEKEKHFKEVEADVAALTRRSEQCSLAENCPFITYLYFNLTLPYIRI